MADRVIANSEPLAEACREFYDLAADQVMMLSNGFDFDEIRNRAAASIRLDELPPATFHVAAAGRLEECKGFDFLLQALNELVNVRGHVNIVASIAGRGSCESELRKLTVQHCLEQVVRFVGFLENLYPLIQSADLFCLTSRYEGMPNVLVEAMSLGVPVLSSDCPHGPREILQGGELGTLISSNDPQLIADGIEQAMQLEAGRAARTAAAQASVLSRFGIQPTTRALEEMFQAAAGQEL